ncbi:carboxymuconolactone decarboxylase family protein [Microbulbifer marinus]|uniref:Alkylhydroperoxidase AhpD family core domain-containing protein n=1 Tax=Microbulbifer marinus TaxID=658218 RepID=A0A1H3WE58_9GAMM|nr:carboxymuconolactone decarboxylase family protein [Microbulbifer marinus]SDZ85419.1 alkylhydroperoxidase AhpD family core domain-containing protein [Microbulbifer marinus]
MSENSARCKSYPDRLKSFEKLSANLSSASPPVMKAFWQLHTASMASGALDAKTKELIALAISVATHCDDCIAHHTNDALEAGATAEEITDALAVAVLMGGGTSVVYACHAIEALEQFSEGPEQ